MILSKIHVRNFRNLRDCKVELQPGLNVLVGRNNVGKSNLLSAIRHALGPSASQGDFLPLTRDDFHRDISNREGKPAPITVDLEFRDLTDDDHIRFFELLVPDLTEPKKSTAQVHFEAVWTDRQRVSIRRWGGSHQGERSSVPSDVLDCIPVTFLPALRDAEAALTPGYRSRLALLFRDLADPSEQGGIVGIFQNANEELEKQPLITGVQDTLRKSTRKMAGSDFLTPSLRAAPPEFQRVLRTLQITLEDGPVSDLAASGLGYQNLLYIATVLAHLRQVAKQDCPLLLVEEPEAHLHPQLVVLLAEYFAGTEPGASVPQTLVTTHSPMLAAHVRPSQLQVIHEEASGRICCNAIARAGLSEKEERALQRMMDVTRSSLYFAKAAILVEGESEALLVPVLARLMGYNLRAAHVSVIPICGVSFRTFRKLLGPGALSIPVAILTDADPNVKYPEVFNNEEGTDNDEEGTDNDEAGTDNDEEGTDNDEEGTGIGPPLWRLAMPAVGTLSDRTQRVCELFKNHEEVVVSHSQVTLEYDLAIAGPRNPSIMVEAWEAAFVGTPQTLNSRVLEVAGTDLHEQALTIWRGICVAKHKGSKAEFAHLLAEGIREPEKTAFTVPPYIRKAIEFVMTKLGRKSDEPGDA
jgi:putative ATP-dependent endonuclease of OLD family